MFHELPHVFTKMNSEMTKMGPIIAPVVQLEKYMKYKFKNPRSQ